jgi:hypothetical protein
MTLESEHSKAESCAQDLLELASGCGGEAVMSHEVWGSLHFLAAIEFTAASCFLTANHSQKTLFKALS